VHGLAAWIAVGDDRISYIGLQIALAFDLGFLQGYGPPDNIDPIRDRFIGIVLGICIVTTVFALIWPESADLIARERLAACLRTIARLLRVGQANNGTQNWSSQREQLELEIASRLSETNSYEEQAAFEKLIQGSKTTERPKLGDAIAATEEIFVCSLPWIREQRSGQTVQQAGEPKSTSEFAERLPNAVEACADRIDQHQRQIAGQDQMPIDYLVEKTDSDASKRAGSLERTSQCRSGTSGPGLGTRTLTPSMATSQKLYCIVRCVPFLLSKNPPSVRTRNRSSRLDIVGKLQPARSPTWSTAKRSC
jgi:hypothetical protein